MRARTHKHAYSTNDSKVLRCVTIVNYTVIYDLQVPVRTLQLLHYICIIYRF